MKILQKSLHKWKESTGLFIGVEKINNHRTLSVYKTEILSHHEVTKNTAFERCIKFILNVDFDSTLPHNIIWIVELKSPPLLHLTFQVHLQAFLVILEYLHFYRDVNKSMPVGFLI